MGAGSGVSERPTCLSLLLCLPLGASRRLCCPGEHRAPSSLAQRVACRAAHGGAHRRSIQASVMCLGISEVSRRCLGGVSQVSRRCLAGVSEVCRRRLAWCRWKVTNHASRADVPTAYRPWWSSMIARLPAANWAAMASSKSEP